MTSSIRPKDRDAVLQSLRAGVVPRVGLRLIQVGRPREVEAALADIERIADGGSSIRFVIGEYGSGKTFFLNLVRSIALEKKLVTAHADLTPNRRLQASGGQARSMYAELMRNVSTRSKPDGGAMASIVERFVTEALRQAREQEASPQDVIHTRLRDLDDMTGVMTSRPSLKPTGVDTIAETSNSSPMPSDGFVVSSAPARKHGKRSACGPSSTMLPSTTT